MRPLKKIPQLFGLFANVHSIRKGYSYRQTASSFKVSRLNPVYFSHFLKIQLVMMAVVMAVSKSHAQNHSPLQDSQVVSTNLVNPASYKKMSLEELMDQDVTIVTRTPEKLSQSPSAVQVVTGEDIRRSGAMTLADAMRLAPNLEVQQANSYAWVVSSRGFDATYANKLQVMIDGRTVYTPLYAGVLWDAQSVLLEDVDRIEAVSGPGGALWGANAVNGVINVVTKSARDTQGLYVSGAGGSFLQDYGAVRYGGQVGSNLFYRVYGQRSDFDSTFNPDGSEGTNSWNLTQGGFRMDYYPSDVNTFTLQGDFYAGTIYNTGTSTNSSMDGQNILGRWTRIFSEDSDMSLQLYFDRTWVRDITSYLSEELNTYDLDFQHRFPIGKRNSILWGAGYRLMQDNTATTTSVFGYVPQRKNMQLFSSFVQDEITLIEDYLKFTIGTKLEHNDFSGFEVQPSGRLAWTPTEHQTIWGAISRAVRSPSRIDADLYLPKNPPYFIAGGPDFNSEKVIAYELGYRIQPIQRLSLSLAGFYNQYDDLYNVQTTSFPLTVENGIAGQSWGAELSGTFQATDWWRLRGGYTYLHKDLWAKAGHSATPAVIASLGNDPENQFLLQSMMDLPAHFQLDVTPRYVDALPDPHTSSYFTVDARIAWQYKHIEIALIGQNLCGKHVEFGGGQEIPRSIYGKVTFRW